MKKNISKIKLMLLSAITLIAACTKLDLQPTDIIDPSKAFRNLNDINMGVIGVYALLDYDQVSLNAIASDEATFPFENTVGNSDAFRWLYTASSGSVTALYSTYYSAIDRANRTLAGLENMALTEQERPLANSYKGELLGLRAYLHFELLRAYAASYDSGALGVPYMKESIISYPARNTFAEVVSAVKADLQEAKTLIGGATDNTRLTAHALTAIQARLALYEKNWQDALTYSSDVINAFPLATLEDFPKLWTDASDAEIVWKLKRAGTSDSRIGGFFYRETGGIVLYAPAFKLLDTYDEANDVRYEAYVEHDPSRVTNNQSPYLVKKYIGGTASNPGLADIKLFRTSEMYLIRAEAKAEMEQDASGDINDLRAVRIRNYQAQALSSKEAAIEAVYLERYKELALEGHRFYDLKRRSLPVQRWEEDAANASGAVSLSADKAQYAFPLPASEILINKNTIQNPDY